MGKGHGRDRVLQGTENASGLLRQQVGARAEKLPQLNQQYMLFHDSVAEDGQHLGQCRTCRLSCHAARCMRTHHPTTLTVHDPQHPEEEAYETEKASQLNGSVDPKYMCRHTRPF